MSMNPLPGLCDASVAEYRPDRNSSFPGHVVSPNGSLMATEDYALMGVLAKEVLLQRGVL